MSIKIQITPGIVFLVLSIVWGFDVVNSMDI